MINSASVKPWQLQRKKKSFLNKIWNLTKWTKTYHSGPKLSVWVSAAIFFLFYSSFLKSMNLKNKDIYYENSWIDTALHRLIQNTKAHLVMQRSEKIDYTPFFFKESISASQQRLI